MVDAGIDFTVTDLLALGLFLSTASRRCVSTVNMNAKATKLFDCKL